MIVPVRFHEISKALIRCAGVHWRARHCRMPERTFIGQTTSATSTLEKGYLSARQWCRKKPIPSHRFTAAVSVERLGDSLVALRSVSLCSTWHSPWCQTSTAPAGTRTNPLKMELFRCERWVTLARLAFGCPATLHGRSFRLGVLLCPACLPFLQLGATSHRSELLPFRVRTREAFPVVPTSVMVRSTMTSAAGALSLHARAGQRVCGHIVGACMMADNYKCCNHYKYCKEKAH